MHVQGTQPPKPKQRWSEDERRAPLRALLAAALPDQDAATNADVAALSGTALRDRLIAHAPLDRDWIARVNQVLLLAGESPQLSSPGFQPLPCPFDLYR